jgi:putative transcriptional regulator
LKIKEIKPKFQKPEKGSLLISEPFLADLNFWRSVVLLAEFTELGSVGFILNKPAHLSTDDTIPGMLNHDFPIYYGGPIDPHSLHFVHNLGLKIPNSIEIIPGIFWGGDINAINDLMERGEAAADNFKFFLGYSGWEPSQIEEEMEEKTWWITSATEELIFDNDLDNMWANVVKLLGEDFAYMANSPEDVSWN